MLSASEQLQFIFEQSQPIPGKRKGDYMFVIPLILSFGQDEAIDNLCSGNWHRPLSCGAMLLSLQPGPLVGTLSLEAELTPAISLRRPNQIKQQLWVASESAEVRGHRDSAQSRWCSQEHMGSQHHWVLAWKICFCWEGHELSQIGDMNSEFLLTEDSLKTNARPEVRGHLL